MYYYPYRQDWSSVIELLNQSLYAEKMVCSMSTQLFHIPTTQNLEGNPEMHEHLVPASYHRVTAVGSAQRLQNGEEHDSIINTLTSCVNSALREDQEVMKWLHVMRDNAPNEFEPFIQNIISWQQQTEQSISSAQQLLRQMGFEIQNQYRQYSY
jgi:adenosyl cobinamide kinase/adenosyl cobinamide phosphate guanylyltransferase